MKQKNKKSKRIQRENKTIQVMIKMYCDHHHKNNDGLCQECSELSAYAEKRVQKCPYGENKPVCNKCTTHCYVKSKREQVKRVMRFAGPRMVWRHPWLAIMHIIDSRNAPPPK